MLRTICRCRDERKVDVGRCRSGQFLLGLLRRFLQTLHCHGILGKIHAFLLLKFIDHPVHDSLVEVVAAQVGVSVGRQNFDDAVTDFDNGNIEGTSTEVIHHDLLLFFIVQTVSKRCCRRLVNDTLHIEACNLACILRCLTLCIVEISRNRDDRFRYFFSQILLRIRLQLGQNHGRDLLR